MLTVLFEFPLLERPFRLTALELLLPIPQFTGAITQVANGPTAAVASVALISAVAATGVPLDLLAGIAGCTGGALLIYVAPAVMTLKLRARDQEDRSSSGGADAATSALAEAPATVGLWSVAVIGAGLGVVGTIDSVGQIM